ncbi:hypothetical protein AR454_03810, partial [Bacillus mycoides]|uniref:hypothetical protein n=1 Tax=Bacillus mycoides TaxID=1405 RepID=UPI002AAF2BE0
ASLLPTRQKALLGRELEVTCDSERAACAFRYIQLQRQESPAISLSRSKQKALLGRELQCPAILNEPLVLLIFKKTKTGSCKMELALL